MQARQNELSDYQIDRQDSVDSLIYALIQRINPGTVEIEWNIEMIGDVRDCLKEWIVDRYGICNEQSFYPYVEEEN